MLGSSVLELAAGLIFIYLLLSVTASAISGKISEILLWRAKFLEKGMRELILGADPKINPEFVEQLTTQFYNHPSIRALYNDESTITKWLENSSLMGKMKSYVKDAGDWVPPGKIDGKTFTLAVLDMLAPSGDKPNDFETLRNTIKNAAPLQGTQIQQTMLTLINNTEGNINGARENIENWFDSVMEQITSRYTKRIHVIAFVIGLIVAVTLNVDTVSVANTLWRNPALREAVSQAAADFATKHDSAQVPVEDVRRQLDVLGLPIGWASCPTCAYNLAGLYPSDWISVSGTLDAPILQPSKSVANFAGALALKILGFLASGLAAAQGSTFWYDLLKKVTSRE